MRERAGDTFYVMVMGFVLVALGFFARIVAPLLNCSINHQVNRCQLFFSRTKTMCADAERNYGL